MQEKHKLIGAPIDRIDGQLKVTGKATYAAEFPMANLAYGFPLQSTIAAGEIVAIDVSEAQKSAGVLKIITHQNALKLASRPPVTSTNRQTRANPVLQSVSAAIANAVFNATGKRIRKLPITPDKLL